MQWIAPSEKDTGTETLENRLWAAADELRANSGLTSAQYSQPVLGLIFLRFAEVRFFAQLAVLEKQAAGGRRGSRVDDPTAYQAEGILYLTPSARFDHILRLPEGSNVGKAVNEVMRDIEAKNPQLAGVLPKTYQIFDSTLLKNLLKKVSEIPPTAEGDTFGRVYEYFLGEFARTEGSRGGEFYTPISIVRLLVEVLEPFHGRILDPACGSGGMFVQSASFVAEHKKSPAAELAIHGQEKVADTVKLCRMNLAIHGLEGDIREGISYYDDLHNATGQFDFVLANPPFNVNAVDKERLEGDVGTGRRFPFGLPRSDNANYLWIQLFYSALSTKGRAGFVMANSASDARSSEQELRRQLIENNQRRIQILETMASALYREWFVEFRFPGHDKIPRVASPLGDIPQGWEVKTVADSFEISGGGTPSRKESSYWDEGTVQWFAPSDLTVAGTMFMDDSPEHITTRGLAESSARLFPAFSVMMTSRATIGSIAINTHEACTNQGFITCLPNERVPLNFLLQWLTDNVPKFKLLASGATFKEISRGVFKTIEFLHPSPALVRRFELHVEPMAEQILELQRQATNLRRTRDLLLPRLLSGQVALAETAS